MEACPVPLPDDNPELIAWVHSLLTKNALLEERLRCLLHKQFAASSEKTSPDQRELFNEAEQDQPESDEPEQAESNITVPEHTRKKKGRRSLPKELPRVREEHDLSEDEKSAAAVAVRFIKLGKRSQSSWISFLPKSRSSRMFGSNMAAVPAKVL